MTNESNKLIPEATDRQPIFLIYGERFHTAIVVIQAAVPGSALTDLRRTAPLTVVTNGEEPTIVAAEAARKT